MDSPLTFLLVDDDIALCSLMRDFFGQEGYRTACVNDGREALAVLTARSFDLVILDVMMPVLNGFEVLQQLSKRSGVPVIMLTARTAGADRVSGLNAVADDYLPKPFDPAELLARIRAVLRRTGKGGQSENQIVESCGVRLNSGTREVWLNGKPVKITAIEFDILDYLMRAAGRLVSRDALAAVLYQREATPFERSIDVHISHFRRKLGKGDEEVIHTMRGAGYLFCPACGTRRMRSIFAKIVVWSFGTLVLSLGAFFLVTAMMMRRPEPGKGMLPWPSGVVEGLNNKAKVTMRRSYGFRTFRTLELALYHSLGKLPEPDSTHEFF